MVRIILIAVFVYFSFMVGCTSEPSRFIQEATCDMPTMEVNYKGKIMAVDKTKLAGGKCYAYCGDPFTGYEWIGFENLKWIKR